MHPFRPFLIDRLLPLFLKRAITDEGRYRGGQIGVRVKGAPRLKAIAQNTGGIKKRGLLIITGELITGVFVGLMSGVEWLITGCDLGVF